MSIAAVDAKRRAIREQMLDIRSMRTGSVSEQYVSRKPKGSKHEVKVGP